jgi:hypothetical protein
MTETNWRKVVTAPEEVKIFEALEDERYEWRTVRALARETELPEEAVRKALAKYPVLVRKAISLSVTGEDLYTLQSRFFKKQGFWVYTSSGTTTST